MRTQPQAGSPDIRLGILGVSHGHPYSISAFFNGYDRERMRQAYPNIDAYLGVVPEELRRIPGARVESIWAADRRLAEHAAGVSRIPHVAGSPAEVVERVDAVLVTEGEGSRHLELAAGPIERGMPLFVDKPLAASWEDVRALWGRTGPDYPILSCSNLRYNPALPDFRTAAEGLGGPVLVRGLTAMDWSGYGWHLAEALVALWGRGAETVQLLSGPGDIGRVEWRDGAGNVHSVEGGDWTVEVRYPGRRRALLQVFYPMGRLLEISLHGVGGHLVLPLVDWFTMMQRMLLDLVAMIRSGRPPAGVMDDTLAVARIITGAALSRERGGDEVRIEDLVLEPASTG